MNRWFFARRVARRFLPHLWLYFYTTGKLYFDPVYTLVEEALRGSERPVLDVGCGMGLLPAYLRACGYHGPIRAFDADPEKIRRAQKVSGALDVDFFQGDAASLPDHCGNVVLLDILHYFDDARRRTLLDEVARRIAPGGVALIRNAIHEKNWRFTATLVEEWIIGVTRWIPQYGWHFPRQDEVCAPFIAAGFSVRVLPMKGIFNSYFFEFKRSG